MGQVAPWRPPPLGGRGEGWVLGQFALLGAVAVTALRAPGCQESLPGAADATRRARVAGAAGLSTLAAVLAGPAFAHLGSSLSPYPRPRGDGTLVRHGVYRHVRHPMYGSLVLGATALALVTSPRALVPTVALALELEGKRRVEERWLVEHYDGYAAYRDATRWRMVPGLW